MTTASELKTQSSVLSPQHSNQTTRWLITGGCGFIGTSLINSLVSEGGHFIRVIDNLSVGSREDLARVCEFSELNPDTLSPDSSIHSSESSQSSVLTPQSSQIELIVGDILYEELALKAAKGIDIIVHLAASTGVEQSVESPRLDCLFNVIGTLNYLEAARHNGVRRFIFASSSAPIGECEPPIHENLAPHPVSPYGASKLGGEAYCSAYYRSYGLETVALRFGNVYGPFSGHKNSVVAKFIRQAINGDVLEIYGDGDQTRDFIYIDDLIQAIKLAASIEGIGGEVFQIATTSETSVRELVDKLLLILTDFGIRQVEISYTEPRQGDMKRNFSDTSKARLELGWQAKVKLTDGIKRTVKWFFQGQT
jgi:UDP-glucose 4-epimerase